jgi:hypothetical protein
MAGLAPAGVICEIMNPDGTMARTPQLAEFARLHGLKVLTVATLIQHRMRHERCVRRIAESPLRTAYGDFRMIAYSSGVDSETHVALVRGEPSGDPPALVRVHSHCLTGDVFSAASCDCHEIMRAAALASAHRRMEVTQVWASLRKLPVICPRFWFMAATFARSVAAIFLVAVESKPAPGIRSGATNLGCKFAAPSSMRAASARKY